MDEQRERQHLAEIHRKLLAAAAESHGQVSAQSEQIAGQKQYLSESRSEMDHAEKVSVREEIDRMTRLGEQNEAKRQRLIKLADSPYFGRIDFTPHAGERQPLYIGVHSFADPQSATTLIHDWRAPVSAMFYDFELGEADYTAPEGRVSGTIDLKRQYRISKGELEYVIESSLHIRDDVLQRELSRNSSEKMKNIVATIQRDQNRIIRNEEDEALIIQGAAGSGKTSIALHRIAYMLYKFRESLQSSDIMIISPNKVFSDYISHILPELGEETILETTMEELVTELTAGKIKFETFFDQVDRLLNSDDQAYRERIRFKSSPDLLKQLDKFVRWLKRENFAPNDIVREKFTIPADFIRKRIKANPQLAVEQRIKKVVNAIAENIKIYHNNELTAKERNSLRSEIRRMFGSRNPQVLYKQFYTWLERPELFQTAKGSRWEWADLFPFLYLKMQLEKIPPYRAVKHLVIDEMQDYSPVQYAVLARLFPCKKTALGDACQSVNPCSASTADGISTMLPESRCVYMNKSYRSTIEIVKFAQQIQRNEKLEAVERHGSEPRIELLDRPAAELQMIKQAVTDFSASGESSLGIICKTQQQADRLHKELSAAGVDVTLLNRESKSFNGGALLTGAHLAKGLEFDRVIVPHATVDNYNSEIDRHQLYVAVTRAMHSLLLTAVGELTPFLSFHLQRQ